MFVNVSMHIRDGKASVIIKTDTSVALGSCSRTMRYLAEAQIADLSAFVYVTFYLVDPAHIH